MELTDEQVEFAVQWCWWGEHQEDLEGALAARPPEHQEAYHNALAWWSALPREEAEAHAIKYPDTFKEANPTPKTLGGAAAAYAAGGWYVFPVDAKKHPKTTNGWKDASRDAGRFHWEEVGTLIGIATGLSHLVVVDIDNGVDKDGIPKDGQAQWEAVAEDTCPTERYDETPHGVHLYFSDPEGLYGCGIVKGCPHVDVKGVGGYVIVPPGPDRKWTKQGTPSPVPEWLAPLLPSPADPAEQGKGFLEDPTIVLLREFGWTIAGGSGKNVYLKPAGEHRNDHGATWNGSVLYMHTTEGPFEAGTGYNSAQVLDGLKGTSSPWRIEAIKARWETKSWDEFFTLLARGPIQAQEDYREAWTGRKKDFDRYLGVGDKAAKKEEKAAKKEGPLQREEYPGVFKALAHTIRLNECSMELEDNGEYIGEDRWRYLQSDMRDWVWKRERPHHKEALIDAMYVEGRDNSYNPLKEALEGLDEWDGIERVADLIACFHSDDPGAPRRMEAWLVGIIKKIYDPAYQNMMLVLQGDQGIGKSYLPKWLCTVPFGKKWLYVGSITKGKDCSIHQNRALIWEVEELEASVGYKDVARLKAFITKEETDVRRAYDSRPQKRPCIANYIGTLNPATFLKDETGNRRFWMYPLTSIDWSYGDPDGDPLDRLQLWAELLAIYRRGDDAWMLTKEEMMTAEAATKEALDTSAVDPYIGALVEYTGRPGDVIWLNDLAKELRAAGVSLRSARQLATQAGNAMTAMGCERRRVTRPVKEGGTGGKNKKYVYLGAKFKSGFGASTEIWGVKSTEEVTE